MANENLGDAKKAKNDEFYTQYHDIEKEMNAYLDFNKDVFRDKTVLLPCDDPEWSNFTKYFAQNFTKLGLRKLISTSYSLNSKPVKLDLEPTLFELESPKYDPTKSYENGRILILDSDTNGDGVVDFNDLEWSYLEGNGDFASDEVTLLRDAADIVVTNPPFSLFRKFLAWVVEGQKEFSILGNMNAITYKEVFPLLKSNAAWLGQTISSGDREFRVPDSYPLEAASSRIDEAGSKFIRVKGVRWFTNLEHGRRHEPLQLMTQADNIRFGRSGVKEVGYQKYDNYDAIEVPYTESIPSDYEGVMGVPISFMDKYNPDQFEILGSQRWSKSDELELIYRGDKTLQTDKATLIKGRETYDRIFLRHKR